MRCSSAYSGCGKRQKNYSGLNKDIIRSLDIYIKGMKNFALFYNFQGWNFKGIKLLNPDTMKERENKENDKKEKRRQAGMNEFRGRIRFFETRWPSRPGF